MKNCDTNIWIRKTPKSGAGAQLCKIAGVKSQPFVIVQPMGATIVSKLSLHSLHGRSIWNFSLCLSHSSLQWVHRCILKL